jgi:protein-S-isoprenylcysteine O-methyltransferase Ste14
MATPPTTQMQLTDKGRAYMRRMRLLFMPVRVAMVLWLVTLPAGGIESAWARPSLRLFMAFLVLMVASERAGITADPSAASRDRASKYMLVVGSFAGLTLGMREVSVAAPWLPVFSDVTVQSLGFLLWGLGLALRQWAMWTLGRFFTDQVRIFQDHKLVQDGPYRWVRHPSYAGLALVMLGAPLSLGSWAGVFATVVLGGSALAFRISVEERELLGAFGKDYEAYCLTRPRLLPFLRSPS